MSWRTMRLTGVLVCLVIIVALLSVQFLSRSAAPATVEAQTPPTVSPFEFIGTTDTLLLFRHRDDALGVTCWALLFNVGQINGGLSCVPDQPDVQAIVEQLFQARLFMYIGFSDPPATEP